MTHRLQEGFIGAAVMPDFHRLKMSQLFKLASKKTRFSMLGLVVNTLFKIQKYFFPTYLFLEISKRI